MDPVKSLRLEEKLSLCDGADAWHTKSFPEAGIPSLTMNDGPHGLRKSLDSSEVADINRSVPATCFPTAVLSACSWDPSLLEEIGRAIGEEAAAEGVGLLLGPGVNVKRNPLCGRNFEYFSEDPYLAGKLAAGFIRGVQSAGVGACLKHFACNSQEYKRFNSDSVLDERTLREIYLRAFEIAVKEGKPDAVMCAYNKINGEHCSDSKKLLTDILRGEWGFDGMVVTDWGAMNDRVLALKAGCDLNMPGGSAYQEEEVLRALKTGELEPEALDRSASRIASLALKARKALEERPPCDRAAHHRLAERAAIESAVLLKNRGGILPLDPKLDVLLLGPMARELRYQGAGSSHINPCQLHQITELRPDLPYLPGCAADGGKDAGLLKEAVAAAKKAGVPVIFAGLPDAFECEGFDRDSMKMPEGYLELIDRVSAVNPHTVVVLMCGSPVEMPWAGKVRAILYMGLPGEAGAEAIVDLLFGKASPGGRLAETWPLREKDCVSAPYYSGRKDAHYREGVYVGYRYYTKAGIEARYPFGFGLSYSSFTYSDLRVEGDAVSCRVKNTGRVDASETVQLYVSPPGDDVYRPELELRGFKKLFLRRGESAVVSFLLDDRCFALWQDGWIVPAGEYRIRIGGCSADLPLCASVLREGVEWKPEGLTDWYTHPAGTPTHIDFERLLGRPVCERPLKKGSYTMDDTIDEMSGDSLVARMTARVMQKKLASAFRGKTDSPEYRMALSSVLDAPLRSLKIFLGRPSRLLDSLLDGVNGRPTALLRELLRERARKD